MSDFQLVKANLDLAVKLKSKTMYDIALAQIDENELTTDEITELRSIKFLNVKPVEIDNNNPHVKAYENAFANGVAKLTPEQKRLLEESRKNTDISDPELKACLINDPTCESCSA